MAVDGVVFDVSDTLVDLRSGRAADGVAEMIARLRGLGVTVLVMANEPRATIDTALRRAGLVVDSVVTFEDVKIKKGSPRWTEVICARTGLQPNRLMYVGDSPHDMITAVQGRVVYAQAEWTGKTSSYGLKAPAPGWVAAVVEHIFRKQRPWYWELSEPDRNGHRVHAMAVAHAGGDDENNKPRAAMIALLKDDRDSMVGPLSMREFVMLHLLASLYTSGIVGDMDWWTTCPGHTGKPNAVMGDFLSVAAKLFQDKYRPDLIERHAAALRSNAAWRQGLNRGGEAEAARTSLQNQISTTRVPAAYRDARLVRDQVEGKRILVVDNFLTWGFSTESARALLRAAGAAEVAVACVGKYGSRFHVVSAPKGWDPFDTARPPAASFAINEHYVSPDPSAHDQFASSYLAMSAETW